MKGDPKAYGKVVNRWNSHATATLVVDGEALTGFQRYRKRVEELLA